MLNDLKTKCKRLNTLFVLRFKKKWLQVMFIICSVRITYQLSFLSLIRLVQAGVPHWLTHTPSQGPWYSTFSSSML